MAFTDDEHVVRSAFERCREFFEDAQHVGDSASVDILSMGMSNDFEIAVEANVVRVGSALVGDPIVEEPEEVIEEDRRPPALWWPERHGPDLTMESGAVSFTGGAVQNP